MKPKRTTQELNDRAIIFNNYYPVSTAVIREKTIVVKREGRYRYNDKLVEAKRAEIAGFSTKSRILLALVITETKVKFLSLLTLTFGATYPLDGKVTKVLLNRFMVWLRSVEKREIDYCWFLEWQSRGAPHIHILLDFSHSEELHIKVAGNWSKALAETLDLSAKEASKVKRQHQRASVWEDIKSAEGAARYVTKYALKPEQKAVPKKYVNPGRFWAASRRVKKSVPDGLEVDFTEDELRQWLADREQKAANWSTLPKVLFLR